MNIDELDLEDLKSGVPPSNAGLLAGMTQGREDWLDRFQEYYLYNFIRRGHGSKVKVLVGSEGTGKTHLLRCVDRMPGHWVMPRSIYPCEIWTTG